MRPVAWCLICTLLVTSCAPPRRVATEDDPASHPKVEVGDHVQLALVDGGTLSGRVRWVADDALKVGETTVTWDQVAHLERESRPNWIPIVVAAAALLVVGMLLIIHEEGFDLDSTN